MSPFEDPNQEKASVSDHKRFMKAVGSIQYIVAVTRRDIAYADVLFSCRASVLRQPSPRQPCVAMH